MSFLFIASSAHALTVNDARIGLHPDKTRLVIELSEMSKFRAFVLTEPWRLVIDLPTFDWQAGVISKPKASAVKGIRQGELQAGVSRIVIDLKQPVIINNAFLLRKNADKPNRLVVDFTKTSAAEFAQHDNKRFGILDVNSAAAPSSSQASAIKAPPIPSPPPRAASTTTQSSHSDVAIPQKKPYQSAAPAPASKLPLAKKPIIVLDPGHGGVDPGAIGANGVFEKHIALAMARELKSLLESSGRYKVILTRDKDIYKKLYQRVAFARAHNADLFISLHADSIRKSTVRGASVYTLSEKASDAQTARLAERENKADIIAGTDLSHEDEQVANILIDIAMRDTMNQSKFFANTLVGSMKNTGVKTLEKPHRHAGFAVLKAPDIPSVLVEIGFMSNRTEARMLSNPDHRAKIARSIAYGVDAYFDKVIKNGRI